MANDGYELCLLETGGIQDFVFGSNSLAVSIGASALVERVTQEWIAAVAQEVGLSHNLAQTDRGYWVPREGAPGLEQNNALALEVIYCGGGNALLLFREQAQSRAFQRAFSRRLLTDAPGLTVTISSTPIDWETQALTDCWRQLYHLAEARKRQPRLDVPQVGLSVTASCVFTGLPAHSLYDFKAKKYTRDERTGQLVSRPVCMRLNNQKRADDDLYRLSPFARELDQRVGMKAVRNFDDFGDAEAGSSYIAVVHADGNRMGKRIAALGDGLDQPRHNRTYLNNLRTFSQSAHDATLTALEQTINHLLKFCVRDERRNIHSWQTHTDGYVDRLPRAEYSRPLFPFRPVISGGDDVTFVTDGRLGLTLAALYLHYYGGATLKDGKPAVGRAGVAIVNTHYPFAQAYSLAETLAASAKDAGNEGKVASLDWHFGVNGMVETELAAVRERRYQSPAGSLLLRPVRLAGGAGMQQWPVFRHLVRTFQTGEGWVNKRNKVKDLFEALREGPTAVRHFRTNYSLSELPDALNLLGVAVRQTGWQGQQSPYFDALEALDFFIDLEATGGGDAT